MATTGSTKRIRQEISNTKNTWINKLQKEDGTTTTSREEIVEEATKYYQKLYAAEEDIEEQEERDYRQMEIEEFKENYSIMIDEVYKTIKELKKEKAPGHDGITNDLLIHGIEPLCLKLQEIFNRIIISEVSRKPYHIKLNKNVTSSSSLPRNSNMEKINNICLDQNVQSEISEDQVGGGLQKCLDIKSNAAASTKSKSTSSLSSIKPASLKAELEKALEDRYGDKLS
ncbi:hypothetical protein M8J75_012022 [Diaphorina citri]|nr:hypothetical protein M8J75_012022 [Diaphorina citri]